MNTVSLVKGRRPTLFISAAEASSDQHAAKVLEQIKKIRPDIHAIGIGGPKLRAAGLESIFPSEKLLGMGFIEILGQLAQFQRAHRACLKVIREENPFGVLVVDYPGFHFRLVRALRKFKDKGWWQGQSYYFIPPKIWVWKKGRIHFLLKEFKKIFYIFPFEKSLYPEGQCRYVGNPLVEQLPWTETRESARKKLGLGAEDEVVTIFLGSRPKEISLHVPLIQNSLKEWRRKNPGRKTKFVLPLSSSLDAKWVQNHFEGFSGEGIELQWNRESHLSLLASDAGWIKSGTASLEAALLDCPHVVYYNVNLISGLIVRYLIRYRDPISLVNWMSRFLYERLIVPELVGELLTPENMVRLLEEQLQPETAKNCREDFKKIRDEFFKEPHCAERVAHELLAELDA